MEDPWQKRDVVDLCKPSFCVVKVLFTSRGKEKGHKEEKRRERGLANTNKQCMKRYMDIQSRSAEAIHVPAKGCGVHSTS